MKAVRYILLITVMLLLFTGTAVATDEYKDLIEWAGIPSSSDPPGTLDYMDPGNPNIADRRDIGTTTCEVNAAGDLVCTMTGTYPGYQAYIAATLANVTRHPVKITAVRIVDKPEALIVDAGNLEGHSLVGKIIPKNSSIDIRIITRMGDIEQDSTYRFKIIIEAVQEITDDDNGGDNGGGETLHDEDSNDGPQPPEIIELEEPPVKSPPMKLLETIKLPVELPELPKTGADMLAFMGAGLALGGIGYMLRRFF